MVFHFYNMSAQHHCQGDHATKYDLLHVFYANGGVLRSQSWLARMRWCVLGEPLESGSQALATNTAGS